MSTRSAVAKGSARVKGRWIVRHDPRPGAALTLFCLPHAGAGPSSFRAWPNGLPWWVEPVAVQLPGREGRFGEPLPTDLTALTRNLAEALWGLDGLLDRPYALFGHSMGALVAFELARLFRDARQPLPVRLLVAGYGAPHVSQTQTTLHLLPPSAVVEELRRGGGTPQVLLGSPELMAVYVPILQADLALCAAHRPQLDLALDLPISAFGGEDDGQVDRSSLRAWRDLTTSEFRLRILPGNHFFPATSRDLLLAYITHDLRGQVEEPARQDDHLMSTGRLRSGPGSVSGDGEDRQGTGSG